MNIIKNIKVDKNNINIYFELEPNEAIIVCSHYIKEQLSKKGVTFDEMYPDIFLVTSLNGNSTMHNIEKIDRLIKLYNPEFINQNNLVSLMSQEKMDEFFQKYHWGKGEKNRMHIKSVEYRGKRFDIHHGALIVVYQEGKKGKDFSFEFGDGWTELHGYKEDGVRIEDIWDRYLFNETVKPWLKKNKLRLSLGVHTSPDALNSKSESIVNPEIALDEKYQ